MKISQIRYIESYKSPAWCIAAIYRGKYTIARLSAVPSSTGEIQLSDIKIKSPKEIQRYFSFFERLFRSLNFKGLGIGQTLMQKFIRRVEKEGFSQIVGNVTDDDAKETNYLLAWYTRLGFEIMELEVKDDNPFRYRISKVVKATT